jgi:hypothetical protein
MTEAEIRKSIETLSQAVAQLQQRIENLEDLRDLETAIAENAGKPLIPWDEAKTELDLEFTPEFEQAIQHSERDRAEDKTARVREPEGS